MARRFMILFCLFLLLTLSFIGITYYYFPAHFNCYLGEIYLQADNNAKAKELFEKSITLFEEQSSESPILELAYKELGKTYLIAKEFDKSQACFEKAFSLSFQGHRERADYLMKLGLIQMIKNNHKLGEKTLIDIAKNFDRMPSISKKYVRSLIVESHVSQYHRHLDTRDDAQAFFALEKGVQLAEAIQNSFAKSEIEGEVISEAYRLYAIELEDKLDFDLSIKYYEKALSLADERHPDYFQLHSDLAVCYSAQNEFSKANEHTAIALRYYQTVNDVAGIAQAYNGMAYCHFKMGNKEESLHYALKALDGVDALRTADMKAALYDTVACAYQLNGDYLSGEKYIKAAIQEAPNKRRQDVKHAMNYYNLLGDLTWAQGKWQEACLSWDVASGLEQDSTSCKRNGSNASGTHTNF